MKKFITLNKYGELYIDKILFETYFPIIFTCKNENNDIFICVCCQCNENGCKWLVGRTNGSFIVRMLQNEITIRQLLLDCCTEKISVDYKNHEYVIAYNNSDWNEESDYLPKKDAYIDAEGGEFDEEIAYFTSIEHVEYNEEYYKIIVKELSTIGNTIDPLLDSITALSSIIGTIPGEMFKTVEISGKLCTDIAVKVGNYINQSKFKPIFSSKVTSDTEKVSVEIEKENSEISAYAA